MAPGGGTQHTWGGHEVTSTLEEAGKDSSLVLSEEACQQLDFRLFTSGTLKECISIV